MLGNLGQLTPAMLEKGAPKPKQQASVMENIASHKSRLESAMKGDFSAPKTLPKNKPIVDILSESDLGQGVKKAKSIFKKAFNF